MDIPERFYAALGVTEDVYMGRLEAAKATALAEMIEERIALLERRAAGITTQANPADDSLEVRTLREIASRKSLTLPGVPRWRVTAAEPSRDYHIRIAQYALDQLANPTPAEPEPAEMSGWEHFVRALAARDVVNGQFPQQKIGEGLVVYYPRVAQHIVDKEDGNAPDAIAAAKAARETQVQAAPPDHSK